MFDSADIVRQAMYTNNPFASEFTIYLQSRDNGTLVRFLYLSCLRGFIPKVLYLPFTPHFLSSKDRCVNMPDLESKCLGIEPPECSPTQLNPEFRISST